MSAVLFNFVGFLNSAKIYMNDTFTIEKYQAAMGKQVFETRSGMLKISIFMKINRSKHLDYFLRTISTWAILSEADQ